MSYFSIEFGLCFLLFFVLYWSVCWSMENALAVGDRGQVLPDSFTSDRPDQAILSRRDQVCQGTERHQQAEKCDYRN